MLAVEHDCSCLHPELTKYSAKSSVNTPQSQPLCCWGMFLGKTRSQLLVSTCAHAAQMSRVVSTHAATAPCGKHTPFWRERVAARTLRIDSFPFPLLLQPRYTPD
jgi:hypothetical protein